MIDEEEVKKLKNLIGGAYQLCDTMDEKNLGTQVWIPDHTTREILKLSMNTFFVYLAAADGEIADSEAQYINELMDESLSAEEYEVLATEVGVDKPEFAAEIPMIFRAFVNLDNTLKEDCSALVYELFAQSGSLIVVGDQHFMQSEYDKLTAYLQMIYDYLDDNLNAGMPENMKPQDQIRKVLTLPDGTDVLDTLEQDDPALLTGKNGETGKKKKKEKKEKTLEELMDELNGLTGLTEVKYDVLSLVNLVRIKSIREKNGLDMPPISLHLVFSGNPGTGKTTVARLLAQIYHKIGILSKGQLIEVDRSGLVAGYVGQTAIKVHDVVEQAVGGVLFIDEAYALTPENSNNDYGTEAVDTLVKAMEDHRDDLIVIAAGYTEPMKRFVAANPGLKSRFNKFIHFPDYTPEELVLIFKRFCKGSGYRPTVDALVYVHEYFTEVMKNKPENFANAREARNLFEFAIARQANRLISEPNLDARALTLLKKEDIMGQSRRIGRSQILAENAMQQLTNNRKRQGILPDRLKIPLDELELSQRCYNALKSENINTVSDILDYMDDGHKLTDIENLGSGNEKEVWEELKILGWEGPQDPEE